MHVGSYDYYGLAKSFIAQDKPSRKTANNRMSYHRNNLYSYSSIIATIDKPNSVIIIDSDYVGYSNTTTTHLKNLYEAIPSYFRVFTRPDTRASLQYYWDQIEFNLGKYSRARSRKYIYEEEAKRLYQEALDWADYKQIDKRTADYRMKTAIFKSMLKTKIIGN